MLRHRLTRLLQLALVAGLLLTGCAEATAMPPVAEAETPPTSEPASPVPSPSVAPAAEVEASPTPSEGGGPAAPPPPTATTASRPVAGVNGGRLLYMRKGNLFQWRDGAANQLTSTGDLAWPRWSPDGQRIAVVRRGDAFSELHLLDLQGQNVSQLTRHQSRATPGSKEYVESSVWAASPSWEPNGARLIYAADVRTTNTTLWLVDAKGNGAQALAAVSDLNANMESPVFGPDGKSLLFCLSFDTPTQLWSLNLTTGIKTQLTDGKQTVYDPAWAPDGQSVAAAIIDGTRSSLWLLSPDGKQRRPLVRRPAARAPTWSPDGTQLAFIGEEAGQFNLYIVDLSRDANGGYTASEPRRLTSEGDLDAASGLSWTR